MEWPKDFQSTGDTTREHAYKKYRVEAITKTVLLPRQIKTAYHGAPLESIYYAFTFTDREDSKQTGIFYCGEHAAKGWFKLNKQNKSDIPFYDPITEISKDGNTSKSKNSNIKVNKDNNKSDLIKCLQTYITLTDDNLNSSGDASNAVKVLKKSISTIDEEPTVSNIRSVNTIFYNTFRGINYKKNNIKSYTDLVNFKEKTHSVKFKSIPIDKFNKLINETRNKSKDYPYIKDASF